VAWGRVRVAALWELGWNTPIKEVELWQFLCRDFDVDALYMSPVSGISGAPVRERHELVEALTESVLDGFDVVCVDERGTTSLRDFAHPETALYVFGKASQSAMPTCGRFHGVSVRIETRLDAGLLWPHQAAAILLYDRLVKSWR